MEFFTIVIIAVGLAMDALAVSIAAGAAYRKLNIAHALRMALFFGAFQGFMPLIGSLAGVTLKDTIASYDHWVAFGLLVIIGGKMIFESFKLKTAEDQPDPANITMLLILSVATSIDALAVGVSLSLITSSIYLAVIIIGLVTFFLSYAGCKIGQRIGHFFENKIEILGGVMLIAIGLKILIQDIITGT